MPKNIVVLTGAGISAESGIHTYRDAGGLWTKYDPMVVSHIRGWKTQPQALIDFKNELRRQFEAGNYRPNAAHHALARLQREWKHGEVTLVTQNIDGLHTDAGSMVYEMHGSGKMKFCEECGDTTPFDADIVLDDACTNCGARRSIRPSVVLFGEMPKHLELIEEKLAECNIYATIGSSCEVAPASRFPSLALANDAETYLINKELLPPPNRREFREVLIGDATVEVPKWVELLLSTQSEAMLK
jgi:NAD-dependent deacetylase